MTLFQPTIGINREGQEAVIAAAQRTHRGQAHFGGSGPAGRTCRECRFWQRTNSWGTEGGKNPGPRPARCRQYQNLMREPGPNVPHVALACRYFDLSVDPQPLLRPQRSFES